MAGGGENKENLLLKLLFLSVEEIKMRIFQSIDIDGNGFISESELKQRIKKVFRAQIDSDVEDKANVEELLEEVSKEAFEELDLDGDGQVSYTEFDKCIEKLYKEWLE